MAHPAQGLLIDAAASIASGASANVVELGDVQRTFGATRDIEVEPEYRHRRTVAFRKAFANPGRRHAGRRRHPHLDRRVTRLSRSPAQGADRRTRDSFGTTLRPEILHDQAVAIVVIVGAGEPGQQTLALRRARFAN